MLKKALTSFATLTLLTSAAFAATGLEGNYKYLRTECASGTPAKNFIDLMAGFNGKIEGHLSINTKQIESKNMIQYKLNQDSGEKYLSDLDGYLTLWGSQPESPEKQKALAEIDKGIKNINELIIGKSCNFTELMDYKILGSVIRTTKTSSTETGCNSTPSTEEKKVTEMNFTFDGSILKLINPAMNRDVNCPAGDKMIFVYETVK
jgi:hypothetical protein